MSKTIWLIRHAENSKDEGPDPNLTPHGVATTNRLANDIASLDSSNPVFILTSNSLRGVRTGEILRDAFLNASKETHHIRTNAIKAETDEDVLKIMLMLSSMEEIAKESGLPEPKSIILIGHNRNQALPLFAATLDPEGFATNYSVPESDRLTEDQLAAISDFTLDEIERMFPQAANRTTTFSYLEAIMFKFTPERWDEFQPGCGRYTHTLKL